MTGFEETGSLTTDKRTVDSSTEWDTQEEWEAFQEANQIEIDNGVLSLAESISPEKYSFGDDTDSYSDTWLVFGQPVYFESPVSIVGFKQRLGVNADEGVMIIGELIDYSEGDIADDTEVKHTHTIDIDSSDNFHGVKDFENDGGEYFTTEEDTWYLLAVATGELETTVYRESTSDNAEFDWGYATSNEYIKDSDRDKYPPEVGDILAQDRGSFGVLLNFDIWIGDA